MLTTLSRSIEGKVAVITGAGSGMGRATAHLFADVGAKVAAIDINATQVGEVVDEMTGAGYDARAWTLDLGDGDANGRR